ncbi:MAG: DNA primase, partial [Candidatus Coproplasma sp.]
MDQEFLRTLKDKLNIVDVAGNYFNLEKKGANYWACCPFHHEKTASFSINESGQYYHCFGCGASGDVIKLVSEMETLDFMDTVKLLAEKAKLPMPETTFDSNETAERKRKRDTLLNIMNDCAHFYLDNLNSGKADAHIQYILNRRIPSGVVRSFGLGASLNFYDLPRFLLSKGYSKRDIIDSGTVNEVEGKLVDAQGGRLIFPIINALDEVIAFGGRVLKKTDFAKYKNTKETVIFNKSKTLYNINLLKKLKRSQTIKEVIMVEGYMDTISLYQAGFKNVVASMGTSLTQEQARLIKRYTDTVLISYDGDGAGQKANLRGLEILKGEGLNVKVVPLPDGLDPDDVIKQRGREGYQACLDAAMPLVDYKLSVVKRGLDFSKTEDKRRYVTEAIKIIKTAESSALQEELLKRVSGETGITYESLNRDLQSQPQQVEIPTGGERGPRADDADASLKASRFVIASLLFGADYAEDFDITSVNFSNGVHAILAKYVRSKRLMQERIHLSEVFEFFEDNSPESEEISRILDYSDSSLFNGEVDKKYFSDCVRRLKLDAIDGQIDSITSALSKAKEILE